MIIKTSMAFEDMRKSAGSITASKNKSRLYLKNRISPRNPRTSSQMSVRGSMSIHAKAWNNLTQAQRDTWNEAAKTTTGKRQLGTAAEISGFNYYMRCCNNLAIINHQPVTVPGETPAFENFEIRGVSYTAPNGDKTGSLYIDIDKQIDNIIIRATAPFSKGKESNATGLRVVATKVERQEQGYDIYEKYVQKFGSELPKGQKVQFEVYSVDADSGIASLKQNYVWTI